MKIVGIVVGAGSRPPRVLGGGVSTIGLWRRRDNNIGEVGWVGPAAPSPNPSHSTNKLFGEPSAQLRTVPVTILLIAGGLYLLNEYTDWYDDPDWPPPMALVPSFRAASEREGATP